MDPFGPKALGCATLFASLLAYRAVKKQSLTIAGATAGFCVGFILVATGLRGMTLFFFYQVGSWATKYKKQVKAVLDETVGHAAVRGANQVLAVSVTAVTLSLYHAWHYGPEQTFNYSNYPKATAVAAAVLAHHAVCLGDTLASELGMATSSPQQLVRLVIPPFPKVPPGTNGGVTFLGTLWSILGGVLCSIFHLGMDGISGILPSDDNNMEYVVRVVVFGAFCGGVGSMIDSFLGATVQITYWDEHTKQVCHDDNNQRRKRIAGWVPLLSNEGVNFVSVLLTTVLGGWVLGPMLLS